MMKKNVTCDAGLCDMWQNVAVIGQRKNTYTLWVSAAVAGAPVPVRFEMLGYDSLLGSHYDRYYLTYSEYTPQPLKDAVFDMGIGKGIHSIIENDTHMFLDMTTTNQPRNEQAVVRPQDPYKFSQRWHQNSAAVLNILSPPM